jgi:carotenoid 1,2-hydratase
MHPRGPDFTVAVATGGYAWWYLDALSDDGQHGLTVIAFIGSVFSPYYAAARRHGPADPRDHCAINVALYGAGGHRWTMTERGAAALHRTPTRLAIGPSSMTADDHSLTLEFDEITAPWPSRVRGTIRLEAPLCGDHVVTLDAAGRHRWRPIAARARIDVTLTQPALSWSGHGYFDSNAGDAPLEQDFRAWHWSRAEGDDATLVLYDVERRDGSTLAFGLRCGVDGSVAAFEPPPAAALPRSRWGVARATRADTPDGAQLTQVLEDGPFYARSVVRSRLLGQDVVAVHESLSLDRFRTRWVQALLPFRMPRRR